MNTDGIKAGDIVKVDIKGRVFIAFYRGEVLRVDGGITQHVHSLDPVSKSITYRECEGREIREHYSKVRSR
jgi:hypothetical protein